MTFDEGYARGLRWGLFWGGKIGSIGAPLFVIGLVIGTQRGHSTCLLVLAVVTILLLSLRLVFLVRDLRTMRAHRCVHASLRPCTAVCGCGCGYTLETFPNKNCGEPCACGCTRPCVTHKGHLGDHGS